jgi:hypothetical protein
MVPKSVTDVGIIARAGVGAMRQRVMLRAPESLPFARVVKLVDTGDLKSPGHCGRAGSSPAPGTT